MIDLRKIVRNGEVRANLMYVLAFLPDELYLRIFYFATTGRYLNLKNPRTFCEKQQWLKLHDRHPEYRILADKLRVRKHIRETLGKGHCFPLLGCWHSFDEIDFDKLPEQFALKCNHDSGSTKVIKNKSALTEDDFKNLKKFYDNRMKHDFFYAGREYPYKGIRRCIIAEKLMVSKEHPEASIEDYKFFCFNGVPKVMFIATDRNTDCKFDFYDMDFNHLDIVNIHPNSGKVLEKPKMFEKMKEIAAKLSKGMKFVRIDLYELNGRIYFGEYTFYHGGGFRLSKPEEWEIRMGDWIDIS